MNNNYHKELVVNATTVSTFQGFKLLNIRNLQTSDIELQFKFADSEVLTIVCDYHGVFKSLNATTYKLLNSHMTRFIEIKKVLGLR